nr:acetylcholinesterase [Hymenolepis microstoma]
MLQTPPTTPLICPHNHPKTRTSVGTYCGTRESVIWHPGTNTHVDVYFGIRYAKPPTGSLRFKKPVPPIAEPDRVFDARIRPDACYQYVDTMFQNSAGARIWQPNTPLSEDCLFLNIFVPDIPSELRCEKNKKFPVMVWIFGGSFTTGSSVLQIYDGRFLSSRQNVIVVTLNYRLGPFGFLYLNSSWVPGNMGLWDQRLALKWIKEHIEDFGGDPSRITLFGESAGAVSVSAHLISPWSHTFFTNAVIQSGTVFSHWGLEKPHKHLNRSKKLLELVGCDGRTGRDMHSCLQLKSPEAFIEAQNQLVDREAYFNIPFPPVIDGHFLPYRTTQKFNNLAHLKPSGSVMLGMNSNEASYFLLYSLVSNASFDTNSEALPVTTEEEYFKALLKILDLEHHMRPDLMRFLAQYTQFEYRNYSELPNPQTWTRMLEEIGSDKGFKCPLIEFAQALVNSNRGSHDRLSLRSATPRTYFYEFVHRTESLPWPKWMKTMHGQEIEYIFGALFSPLFMSKFYGFTKPEMDLADRMMTYWTNFARTGNPNIMADGKSIRVSQNNSFETAPESNCKWPHSLPMTYWEEFTEKTESYLILDTDRIFVARKPRSRQCKYWNRWYPVLAQHAENISGSCPRKK